MSALSPTIAHRQARNEASIELASISDEIATITLLGGGTVRARGQATAGDKVFVRGDVIEGPAPNLTVVVYEV